MLRTNVSGRVATAVVLWLMAGVAGLVSLMLLEDAGAGSSVHNSPRFMDAF